jgi:hypothetical protein
VTDAAPVTLRIGVALALRGDVGELFADAKAIEAAGADSLWVDGAEADPYVMLAALAAVTWRVRLVATGAAEAATARDTCARLARGRLVSADDLAVADTDVEAAASFFAAMGQARPEIERWLRVGFPASRDAWNELRRGCTAAGATGIVLPNDPRLIDLLRNPDVVEDRSDLKLSFG